MKALQQLDKAITDAIAGKSYGLEGKYRVALMDTKVKKAIFELIKEKEND